VCHYCERYWGQGATSGLIPEWLIVATGSVLVLHSAFWLGQQYGALSSPACPPPRIDVSHIPPWLLVAVNGFLALVHLPRL
jgi:putative membrane protein